MYALVVRLALAVVLMLVAGRVGADTINTDATFNAPLGYAKVSSYLAGSTYLSSRTTRLLIDEAGNHYQIGTGQTASGVSPAQAAIAVVSLNSLGALNSGFFGSGRRAIKLAPGGVLSDTVVTDAVLVPKFGVVIAGRFIGQSGGYVLALDYSGNAIASFGAGGVRYLSDMQPTAIAQDPLGVYVVGTRDSGSNLTGARLRAIAYNGGDIPLWNGAGMIDWDYVDAQSRRDYHDVPASITVASNGRVIFVGSSARPGSLQTLGHIVMFDGVGVTFSRVDDLAPCEPDAPAENVYSRVIASGSQAYIAVRNTLDNSACPSVPRQSLGVMSIHVNNGTSTMLGYTSTRACCAGDGAGLAVTDIARDVRGRLYLSFVTALPGTNSRGHLVRFDPQVALFNPDPDFGDAGFGTYNLDAPGAQAELGALAFDPSGRLVAAGAYTSDILGNPQNVDHWAFRIRDERLFRNGFE